MLCFRSKKLVEFERALCVATSKVVVYNDYHLALAAIKNPENTNLVLFPNVTARDLVNVGSIEDCPDIVCSILMMDYYTRVRKLAAQFGVTDIVFKDRKTVERYLVDGMYDLLTEYVSDLCGFDSNKIDVNMYTLIDKHIPFKHDFTRFLA